MAIPYIAYMSSFREIRDLQTSLVSLVESVPGVRVAVLPVTTVKLLRIDTELAIRQFTARRNVPEIHVFESFFPEGDTGYMCGIRIGNGKDAKSRFAESRELLPDLIRKYMEETNADRPLDPAVVTADKMDSPPDSVRIDRLEKGMAEIKEILEEIRKK